MPVVYGEYDEQPDNGPKGHLPQDEADAKLRERRKLPQRGAPSEHLANSGQLHRHERALALLGRLLLLAILGRAFALRARRQRLDRHGE